MCLLIQRDSNAKNKIKEEIERYSILRTVSAVERADVVVLMIDAEEGITEQDAKIAGIAHDRGRGMIIAVNKWDAIEKDNHSVKNLPMKSAIHYRLCRMRRSYLSRPRPGSVFQSCLMH